MLSMLYPTLNLIVCGRVPWLYQYWPDGFMFFVVLCPGTPEGSTGSGSGFKASQKTLQQFFYIYKLYHHKIHVLICLATEESLSKYCILQSTLNVGNKIKKKNFT